METVVCYYNMRLQECLTKSYASIKSLGDFFSVVCKPNAMPKVAGFAKITYRFPVSKSQMGKLGRSKSFHKKRKYENTRLRKVYLRDLSTHKIASNERPAAAGTQRCHRRSQTFAAAAAEKVCVCCTSAWPVS